MPVARRLLIGTALLAAFATPGLAQDNGVAGGLFAEIAGNDDAARALLLDWFGTVPAEHEPLYIDYLQELAADPAAIAYIVAQTGQPTDPATYLTGTAQGAIQAAILAGVVRLTSDQQVAYYDFAIDTFDWVAANDPAGCITMLEGTATAEETGEDPALAYQNAYQSTLSADQIAAILDMSRGALAAEINDTPPVNNFTEADLTAGLTAYQTALNAALAATGNADALIAAAQNLGAAPAADACALGQLTLGTLTTLAPPERDWAVQALAGRM